jgi:hypothetical protein
MKDEVSALPVSFLTTPGGPGSGSQKAHFDRHSSKPAHIQTTDGANFLSAAIGALAFALPHAPARLMLPAPQRRSRSAALS